MVLRQSMVQISWTGAIEIRKPIASIRSLRGIRLTLCSALPSTIAYSPAHMGPSSLQLWEQYPSVD